MFRPDTCAMGRRTNKGTPQRATPLTPAFSTVHQGSGPKTCGFNGFQHAAEINDNSSISRQGSRHTGIRRKLAVPVYRQGSYHLSLKLRFGIPMTFTCGLSKMSRKQTI